MATHPIKLRPFTVPNFVLTGDPPTAPEGTMPATSLVAFSFPLSDLEATTLATMCSDFRAAVFAKAGKPDPEWDDGK